VREIDEKQLEAMVTQVLDWRPAVHVPEDFAARVSARVATVATTVDAVRVERRRFSAARAAAMAAIVVVTIALFAMAPHVQMKTLSVSFAIEMLLLVELAGIGYGWMRLRENGL